MTGSHIAGAGIGALVGAILVSLGTRIGLDLTNLDAATLGMAAVGVFLGIGHAIGEYGLLGIGSRILRGRPKVTVSMVTAETAEPKS